MEKIYINTFHNTGYYFVIVSYSYLCLHKQANNNFSKFLWCYILLFSVEDLKHLSSFKIFWRIKQHCVAGNTLSASYGLSGHNETPLEAIILPDILI